MSVNRNVRETRDLEYLEPELKRRLLLAMAEYANTYPDEPSVFVTQTYRSPEYQNELYAKGRTAPGRIVTNVKGGGSYHNMFPAMAVDIAFNIPNSQGGPWCRTDLFHKFGAIGEKYGLEWGGAWKGFVDMPHFQVPAKLADLKAGKAIVWPDLLHTEPVFSDGLPFNRIFLVEPSGILELDLDKVTLVGTKLYIKPKD